MKKLNKNGFTLIELIIAISIFTVVIFIGYNIFNRYSTTVKLQNNINQGQMTMNVINKYLTKDLEKASGVTLQCIDPSEREIYKISNGETDREGYLLESLKDIQSRHPMQSVKSENKLIYRYTIDTEEGKSPNYTVELMNKDNSSYVEYSIYRELEGESKIYLVEKYKTKKEGNLFKLPLIIEKNNPYLVTIGYEESLDKTSKYQFEVASRYMVGSVEGGGSIPDTSIPTLPDIQLPSGYDAIGFWTADKSKLPSDNLYSWINNNLSMPGQQDLNKEDIFVINAQNSANGNSGHTWSKIGYLNDWRASIDKDTTIKPKDINEIMIYVSKNTTLSNIKDSENTILGFEEMSSNTLRNTTLYGGDSGTIYEGRLSTSSKHTFNITGNLSIDKSKVSSGFVLIIYSTKDTELPPIDTTSGDLVFNYTKTSQVENSTEFNWEKEVYYNMLDQNTSQKSNQNKHNGYSEGFNIFLNTMDGYINSHTGGNPSASISHSSIKNIVGMKIKLEGDIKVTNFNFPGYQTTTLINNNTVYEFKGLSTQQHNISGNVEISSNGNIGDTSKIIIEFIYK